MRRICGLLESPDAMRRHAAVIVLGELKPKEAAVVDALGKLLQDANPVLAGHILDALEAMDAAATVPHVLPLLNAESMELKLRAVALAAGAGDRVVPEIRRRLEGAKPADRLLMADLLARIHTKAAFEVVLTLLFDPDFEFAKAVCEAVRRHMTGITPKARALLHAQLGSFIKEARVRDHERVTTSCLLLLGTIGDAGALKILLGYAAPRHSLYVRRHALIGLKNLAPEGSAAAAVARQIAPYLAESDEGLVRHALDILSRVPAAGVDWAALLESAHTPVRAFAVRRLALEDTATANSRLLRFLKHPDTDVREVAAGALSGHKSATKLLLDALEKETDPESAWSLAKILKPHSEAIDAKRFKRLAALAAADLRKGLPRHEALLYALRNANPAAADDLVLAAGLEQKKLKHWAAAIACLRRLTSSERFDDEARYALSVCNLKVSPKDITPNRRAEDHALRGLQGLLRVPAFKLAERLKKDKTLEASDLFYVGFHFAEMAGDEKALGVALLEHLAKTAPRSAEGKAAKNKLKLVK
ncbi:MAG: HEAT repeat domain-containing protein [bacterium]